MDVTIHHDNQTNLDDENIVAELKWFNQIQFLRINDQLNTMCHNRDTINILAKGGLHLPFLIYRFFMINVKLFFKIKKKQLKSYQELFNN